jgi:hypothetical protein
MTDEIKQLGEQSEKASTLLSGKVVARVVRNRSTEVLIEFTDGTRLFVDIAGDSLELSITNDGNA